MKKRTITVTEAARNFADCVNRTHYPNVTFVPLKNGVSVARLQMSFGFARLRTTEQGDSATEFRVDYLKPSGAIGFYHPDWVVVQTEKNQDQLDNRNERFGCEDTEAKDEAIEDWCNRISKRTGRVWGFARVNQGDFVSARPKTLAEAVTARLVFH